MDQQTTTAQICFLCNRETPLYFYQQRDIVNSLHQQSLTKLCRQMRSDLLAGNRGKYLQYIRIKANFVTACPCEPRQVHSYCLTAMVIRSRRIYCANCPSHFKLFIRKETICSNRLLGKLVQYLFLSLLLIAFTSSILVLDGYLKVQHAKYKPEQAALDR